MNSGVTPWIFTEGQRVVQVAHGEALRPQGLDRFPADAVDAHRDEVVEIEVTEAEGARLPDEGRVHAEDGGGHQVVEVDLPEAHRLELPCPRRAHIEHPGPVDVVIVQVGEPCPGHPIPEVGVLRERERPGAAIVADPPLEGERARVALHREAHGPQAVLGLLQNVLHDRVREPHVRRAPVPVVVPSG